MSELEGNGSMDDNQTFDCYSLANASTGEVAFHGCVLSVIVLFSLLGNGFVLTLVALYKKLRTSSTIIALSLVMADILYTLNYALPALVTTVTKDWVFTERGCIAFGFLASELVVTRWFIVGLLCLDRFFTIRFPFSYSQLGKHSKRRKVLKVFMTAVVWLVPFVLSVLPYHLFANYELRDNVPTCLPNCMEPSGRDCQLYYMVLLTISYIAGSIVPITIYCYLYRKARSIKKSAKHKIGHYTVQIASGVVVTQPIAKYPKESRENQATKTFLLLFMSVMVTGTPGYLMQMIRVISVELHCAIPLIVHFIVTEFFLCAPVLTPLVIMRDRDFRACIAQLFCCGKKTSDLEVPYPQDRRGSVAVSGQRSFGSSSGSQSRRSSIVTLSTSHASQEFGNDRRPANNACPELKVYTITESAESESSIVTPPPNSS